MTTCVISNKKTYLTLLTLLLGVIVSESYAQVHIVTQAEWGGKDSISIEMKHTIRYITIHHSGEIYPVGKDAITYLRNLQSWSRREKKWIDIPYHYLIDPSGVIYQGRLLSVKGDTNTTYDPEGHALICMLGNFEVQHLNENQISSLKEIVRDLAHAYSVSSDNIKTHKDYAETLCPGKDMDRYLADDDWQSYLKTLE